MVIHMSTEDLPDAPRYLKLKAIAQELDVSESVVKRLIYRGELPSLKVGKEHRVERSAYEAWKQRASEQGHYNEDSQVSSQDSSTLPPQKESKS